MVALGLSPEMPLRQCNRQLHAIQYFDRRYSGGNRNSVITDDGKGTAHRVGENLKIEEDSTVGVSEEATKPTSAEKSSNGLIYGIGGIILAGIAVLAGFLIKKKRG